MKNKNTITFARYQRFSQSLAPSMQTYIRTKYIITMSKAPLIHPESRHQHADKIKQPDKHLVTIRMSKSEPADVDAALADLRQVPGRKHGYIVTQRANVEHLQGA